MKFMTLGMGVLSAAMIFTTVAPVHAATTTMYLVDHYKGDRTYFPNQKLSYNKNGLISLIKQIGDKNDFSSEYADTYNESFTYKNNRIKQIKFKSKYMKQTNTPHYKGSKLNKLTIVRINNPEEKTKMTTTYTYKGAHFYTSKLVSTSSDSKEKKTYKEKYTYTNGLLTYKERNGSSPYDFYNYAYDYGHKGYLTYKNPVILGEDTEAGVYFKNTYANGLLKSTKVSKYKSFMAISPKAPVLTVTYKKVKVNASLAKKVKAQQAWILRNIRDDSIYNC